MMLVFTEAMKVFTGLTAITVVFLVAAILLVAFNRTVERKARNVFLACLIALVFITLADWFATVTSGRVLEFRFLHAALMGLTFAVAPVLPVAVANTIYPARHAKWISVLIAAHAVFEIASIFGGFVFWVDESNVYHRGTLYPVYVAVYTITSAYLIVQTFRAARTYQAAHIATVFGVLACMFTGVVIQLVDGSVRMTWPAAAMAIVLYFLLYSEMVLCSDALTKLLNRHSFEDAVARPVLPCAVAVIDIDDFKIVNDTYGHAFGDECLVRVAQMIRRSFSPAGLSYRTGGDEFTVIMTKRLDEADAFAATLTRLIDEARQSDERMPSVSIGLAAVDGDHPDINEALMAADRDMYEFKRSRKQAGFLCSRR